MTVDVVGNTAADISVEVDHFPPGTKAEFGPASLVVAHQAARLGINLTTLEVTVEGEATIGECSVSTMQFRRGIPRSEQTCGSAREMQPLNTPQLLTELEGYLTRNEVSDPLQLVPLLKELKTDYHIPLIARNHADRILKKIEK